MSDFQFRTRGQQSPQGKQRVYFTCHPEDFEMFFETIVKEIIGRQDCAVFYLEPGTQPEDVEDYKLRLREMQLFVVPVTTKLLIKANRAMDVDVPFAFENHIPVLPLMQESGLDDVFNKKFGDLQFLDKHNTDPTAIPYKEKLTKYLQSVIVGDELAKKVRAAFDAYIFLSYRKKDRKYAQELMKLIHSNPVCRDIAIWYDEFLTPGENFNEAIRAALEKSEVFALAVTPNLINEINYILTTEYPMACEMGKKILPAEMEATDRDKLGELYADLPELIANGDTAALAARLSVLLKAVAVRENDTDPQHNFFIGLAYLGGIDVEVDHERAVTLISGSAEQGYIPALKKLVAMYNNGEGVKRDYHKAVAWQEKLVEQRRKNYEASPNEDDAGWLLYDLWRLGDAYRALAQLSPTQKTYEEMCLRSEAFAKQYTDKRFVRYQYISYNLLGDIANACGKLSEAEQWYFKSIDVAKPLAEKTKTVESRRDLSVVYIRLGDVTQSQGKLSEAEEWYRKGFDIRESLAEEMNTVHFRRDLMVCNERLGDIAQALGKLSEAEKWYRKNLADAIFFVEEMNTVESRRDLSVSYEKLGDIATYQGKLSEAEEWYRKSLAIFETLVEETNTVQSRRDLLVSNGKLGDIAKAQGKLDKAEEFYRKSFAIRETLVEETNTVKSRRDLLVGYRQLGDIAKAQGKPDEAEKFYRKSFAICKSLAEETNTVKSRRDLSVSYNRLGGIAKALGKLTEAEEWYRKGLAIAESLAEETNTIKSRRDLSISYNRLGDIAKALGKLEEAEEWYRKGLAIFESIAEETNTALPRRDLSVSYNRLGDNAKALGKLEEAEEWYRKSLAIAESLAEETNTVKSYDDLAVSYYNMGVFLRDRSYLDKALHIWTQLAAQFPDTPSFQEHADIAKRAIQHFFPK